MRNQIQPASMHPMPQHRVSLQYHCQAFPEAARVFLCIAGAAAGGSAAKAASAVRTYSTLRMAAAPRMGAGAMVGQPLPSPVRCKTQTVLLCVRTRLDGCRAGNSFACVHRPMLSFLDAACLADDRLSCIKYGCIAMAVRAKQHTHDFAVQADGNGGGTPPGGALLPRGARRYGCYRHARSDWRCSSCADVLSKCQADSKWLMAPLCAAANV